MSRAFSDGLVAKLAIAVSTAFGVSERLQTTRFVLCLQTKTSVRA
jgi:hypothetical protein